MYTYQITATEAFSDFSDKIKPGDILAEGDLNDPEDAHKTIFWAETRGEDVKNGMSGGGAFNAALETAEVRAVRI